MSGPLLVIVMVIYFTIAILQALKHDWANFIIFSGYAFSCIGLLMLLK